MTHTGRALVAAVFVAVLAGCTAPVGKSRSSTPSALASATQGAAATEFPNSTEPVPFDAGTYRIPKSAWSVVDFSVTFPEDWTVQYGHVYATDPDTDEELGFYPVVVDEIYADACEGTDGEVVEVGPTADDLAEALLQQPGPDAAGPVSTTLGGYPAVRVELSIPDSLDLAACRRGEGGLQVWYSTPADKYLVLLPNGTWSVFIIDVDGQRQVFVTGGTGSSDEHMRQLQRVLDSIQIQA